MKIFQQCNARNWRFNRSRLHDRLSPNEREGAKQQQKLLPSSSFPACRTRSRLDERDKGKSFIGCSFDATFCKNVIGIKWRIIRFLSVKEKHRERWLVGFSSLSLSLLFPLPTFESMIEFIIFEMENCARRVSRRVSRPGVDSSRPRNLACC